MEDEIMKKYVALALLCLAAACTSTPPEQPKPKEVYPYGMTEKEWNELSIKDKARIRRDFYFYEKGSTHFVNPDIEVEGRKTEPNMFSKPKTATKPAADMFTE